MPKLPSEETVICKPVKEDEKDDMKQAEKALDKVRDILNDKEVMQLVWDSCPEKGQTKEDYQRNRKQRIIYLCELAGVSYNDYKRFLKMSRCGYSVVLQRDTDEVWINAFHPDWLRAWNGNIDVSPVFGFYVVITYITDYNYKTEPEDNMIREALKSCEGEDMKTKMKVIAHTFLTAKQMGEPLAIYKLIPDLTMTNSNVGCQWVSLEREDLKMKRMRKATAEDKKQEKTILTIEDVEGEWVNSWDMRDKYLRRPAVLHHCSFAQFARMYSTCKTPKQGDDTDTLEDVDQPDEPDEEPTHKPKQHETPWDSFKILARCKGLCCHEKKNKLSRRKQPAKVLELPPRIEIEKPNSGEGRHMQRRNVPATLRYYKANKN